MHGVIKNTIKTCKECQKCKPLNYDSSGPVRSHKPTKPLEKISIDLMGPLPTGRGGTHFILTVLDTFTKYIKLYALKKATKKAILKRIVEDYIPSTGRPLTILSDNGTQFKTKIWEDTLREKGIETQFTTRYHPQANPVERYNQEIGKILRVYCNRQHTRWPMYLSQMEKWLNGYKKTPKLELRNWATGIGENPPPVEHTKSGNKKIIHYFRRTTIEKVIDQNALKKKKKALTRQ